MGVQFDGTQMVSHSDFNDITYVRNIQAFDLTRCYGKGNEPTAEEFRKRMRKPFYDKTEETLVGMNATGIACTGFNLWDGTWEKNTYYREVKDYSLYLNGPAERWVTNPIPVIPNTKYRISSQSMAEHANWAQVYDLECEGRTAPVTGEHIGGTLLAVRQLLTKGWYEFTVGPDATHMAFMFWDPEYGSPSPKPNDVCISRVLDSDRSMDYRKYERWVHELPIKTYFPNGMHGIGSVRDELTSEKAIKRCGIVDLESLTWQLNTQTGFYEADAPEDMLMPESDTDKAEVLAEKYTAVSEQDAEEGTIYLFTVSEAKKIGAKKTGGSGAPDGMAVYLLEEPVETTLPAEINLFFEADEYGTEEIVYEGETTPITMKFSHGTDFRGKLMTMDKEFQSQKSMRELLNTLGSVIGAPITQHWNEEEQKWTYEMG